MYMDVRSWQTQCSLVQLCAESKYTWVWQVVEPNILGFNYALRLSICGFDKLLDPTFLDSAMCRAQVHVDLIIMLSLNTYGFDELLNLTSLGSAMR